MRTDRAVGFPHAENPRLIRRGFLYVTGEQRTPKPTATATRCGTSLPRASVSSTETSPVRAGSPSRPHHQRGEGEPGRAQMMTGKSGGDMPGLGDQIIPGSAMTMLTADSTVMLRIGPESAFRANPCPHLVSGNRHNGAEAIMVIKSGSELRTPKYEQDQGVLRQSR